MTIKRLAKTAGIVTLLALTSMISTQTMALGGFSGGRAGGGFSGSRGFSSSPSRSYSSPSRSYSSPSRPSSPSKSYSAPSRSNSSRSDTGSTHNSIMNGVLLWSILGSSHSHANIGSKIDCTKKENKNLKECKQEKKK